MRSRDERLRRNTIATRRTKRIIITAVIPAIAPVPRPEEKVGED